jgi:hypothetical protein
VLQILHAFQDEKFAYLLFEFAQVTQQTAHGVLGANRELTGGTTCREAI